MILAIFRKLFVLFVSSLSVTFGQSVDNVAVIELGSSTFPIERPFTISVLIPNSETRPAIAFPDIPSFVKQGVSTRVTTDEVSEKTITNQVITQSYQARTPGRFRLPPFTLTINGTAVQSAGTVLTVRPSPTASAPLTTSAATPAGETAYLALRPSKSSIYAGEGLVLTLSFFVADTYPYVLNFVGLDRQLQSLLKQIRLPNTWEENKPIRELRPVPVLVKGKKFREYRLYQSVFFPLSARPLRLPAVSLRLSRQRPIIGPPSAQPDIVLFSSAPVLIDVRPQPFHPLRGRLPVGQFRLEEHLGQAKVGIGQSVRYAFSVVGEGNIATLPPPVRTDSALVSLDVFPPEERHSLVHAGGRIGGHKTFTYFLVPRQNGLVSLASYFRWIYFNPVTARYDTLQSNRTMQVGNRPESRSPALARAAATATSSD